MQGGVKGELNIGKLVGKRLQVIGTALRARPVGGPHGKGAIVAAVVESVWPMIADGRVRPVIGRAFRWPRRRRRTRAGLRRGVRENPADGPGLRAQPSDASARTSWSTSAIVE